METSHERGSRMILKKTDESGQRLPASMIRFPDFDISWAGENPWDQGFCFGSEDGQLLFRSVDGQNAKISKAVVKSGDPINGVAFLGTTTAVSTRSEVVFFDLPP